MKRDDRQRKRTRQQNTPALHSGKGEVVRHSAKRAVEAPSPQNADGSTPPVDPNREWLITQLRERGVEKPSVGFDPRGVWTCRDGRKTLGKLAHCKVQARDLAAVEGLFDLRAAVTLRIVSAPWDVLWAISRCMPHVQRTVTLGLLRKEQADRNPASWSYTRGVQAVQEWRQERAAWAAKAKEPEQKLRAVLDSAVAINSGIVVAATKRAFDRFNTWEKTKQREAAPPWAKSIGFDLNEQHVAMESIGKSKIVARLSLLGMKEGSRQPQPVVRLSPQGGSAWATVRRILDGTYKSRSARIVNDEGKWLLKLSYTMPRPGKSDEPNSLLVRRGMSQFLLAWCSDGKRVARLDSGASLIKIKRQFEARRNDARSHLPHQGKGARGHGKARFYRLYENLGAAEERFVATWCQQTAALVVSEAKRLGCGTILLEDFGQSSPPVARDPYLQKLLRKFPFAQLREAITWAATKVGIDVKVQRADYEVTCPQCGAVLHVNERTWAECAGCKFEGGLETINAWRLFEAAGVKHDMPLKVEAEKNLKSIVEGARKSRRKS